MKTKAAQLKALSEMPIDDKTQGDKPLPQNEHSKVQPHHGGSQATQLVQLASDYELFHAPDQMAYAKMAVGDHLETWLIKSRTFRQGLARAYYKQHHDVPNAQALHDAIRVLEGKAIFDGEEQQVYSKYDS